MAVSTARLAIRHAESQPAVAPYVPRRHPGVRGTWDRAAIVAALREWATQTGGPPRRQDWTGERSSDGSTAQRKWMAEHPRWPSSSCVAAHFGSWSAALEAAGLPARRLTFETSVADRVAAARRMAAGGIAIWAIAQALEVSVSSVNNYLRARPCPACGGPVTSRRAERCSACTAHEPTVARAWTREAVRGAMRDWQAEHGRAPSYRDWTPSRGRPRRWEAESPRWPSAAVVCDLYADCHDPWNAALADAGAQVRFRRWSDDAVRTALAGFWARTGRVPTRADVLDPAWQGPCAETLRRRYDGVANAWSALGPVPQATRLG
jgi:HNH endonuclease